MNFPIRYLPLGFLSVKAIQMNKRRIKGRPKDFEFAEYNRIKPAVSVVRGYAP